jgi:hypothetical protein
VSLSGFTNPLSPRGVAQAVEATPHHISTDCIKVVFRAGEDEARAWLPEGLEPVEGGLGFAWVADMLKVSMHEPDQAFLNPERTQYEEGAVGWYCRYQGQPGIYFSSLWVTQDWSMLFGQIMGWGKKLAEVHRTRLMDTNPGMGPVAPGTRLAGVVHRHGQRLLRVGIEVERAEAPADLERAERPADFDGPWSIFMQRYFPSVGPDIPEINQLCALRLTGVQTGPVWSGRPFLEFGASDNEELTRLAGVEPLRAYAYEQGWTTETKLELLRNLAAVPVAVRS